MDYFPRSLPLRVHLWKHRDRDPSPRTAALLFPCRRDKETLLLTTLTSWRCTYGTHKGPVRWSYNPYFSACFFSRNSVFLSQQISRNSISTCFFSEANGANIANSLFWLLWGLVAILDVTRYDLAIKTFFNASFLHIIYIPFDLCHVSEPAKRRICIWWQRTRFRNNNRNG